MRAWFAVAVVLFLVACSPSGPSLREVSENPERFAQQNLTLTGKATSTMEWGSWCGAGSWSLLLVDDEGYRVQFCRNEKTKRVFAAGETYTISGVLQESKGAWVLFES
jgi:hypothetical protein